MAVTVSQNELHRVVATAIIYRRGKYLILKRSEKEKAFPGKWTVPGGGLHPDDYVSSEPTTAAGQWYFVLDKFLRREVLEETGLKVGDFSYLLDLVFVRPDQVPVVVLSFYARYKSGKVKLNEDHADFAWVSAKEAKKYDLIEGIWQEIGMVDELLRRKKMPSRERRFKQLLKSRIY